MLARSLRPALAAFMMFVAAPALADDSRDVRTAISSQLRAFKAGDGAAAYSHAAPNVRAIFPDVETFMSMVRQGYDPVYNSASSMFGEMAPLGSGFRQEVYLTDSKGQSWIASYTLERQPDGSMAITGCSIRKSDDVSV